MHRKNRRKLISRTAITITIFLLYVNIFPPESPFSFLGFYLLATLTLFFFFMIFLDSKSQSILWSLTIITFLILRQFHLENVLNILILASLAVTLAIYFSKS
ncbi:hypothetical protein M1271_05340 [Patescibacteria group bacterium]|nr:hypothetical protein [Patescibacteria group bacterium]MCL5797956.1 hypothetical protein [Patescibacteria group bacterium]